MKKNNGFTLIELLAVIVILAIIALIAVPIVINIIDKTRKNAFQDSAYGVLKSGELYYALNEDTSEKGISIFASEIELNHKEQFKSGIIKKKGNEITLINVGNERYCANGTTTNLRITKEDCSSGDKEAPAITGFVTNKITSNSITIIVEATDNTDIMGYYYSKDNGTTYTKMNYQNTYTFTGLKQNTEYQIKVKVEDYFGNTTESDILTTNTKKIEAPTYSASKTEWTKEDVTVTITYPSNKESNWVYEYKIGEKDWVEVKTEKAEIKVTENGSLIARVRDSQNETNIMTSSTYNVENIDKTPPTITINPSSVSILQGTNYNLNTGITTTDLESGVRNTIIKEGETIITSTTELAIGSHTLTYVVTDNAGNISTMDRTLTVSEKYQETILNGAYPEIGEGMIPITIDSNGTVRVANLTTSWYSYANKRWANVVTVTETTRNTYQNAAPGSIIKETDILTYFVWIPRYRYQLWNVNGDDTGLKKAPFTIPIYFENKDTPKKNGTTNGSWLTHPSFTFGEEELNGYWVGKFETGYSGPLSESTNMACYGAGNLAIKPNIRSCMGNTVSTYFYAAQQMGQDNNKFGLSNASDPHMMKNTEWGAVAYLSHSKYGRAAQIYMNNSGEMFTGCTGTTANSAEYMGCQRAWNTSTGYLASTTGTIYGIYDMSGGLSEYVAAHVIGRFGKSEFDYYNPPDKKYFDEYEFYSDYTWTYEIAKLGDATREMGPFDSDIRSTWYQNYIIFIYGEYPWFLRGGSYDGKIDGGPTIGIFSGTWESGQRGYYSFRVVLLGR